MTTHADGFWMQRAFKNAGKGLFHNQLGISLHKKIPMSWLRVIKRTPIDHWAHNPTMIGYEAVKVTHLIKHRAIALLNADMARRK
jgi:hypothetical protein